MARVEAVEMIAVGSPLVPVVGASCQLFNEDGTAATHYDQRTGGTPSSADLVTDAFGRIRRADGSRWFIEEGQDYRLTYSGGTPPVAAGERWLAAISGDHVDDTTDVHGLVDSTVVVTGAVITAVGPLTESAANALLTLGSTLYETDAAGNVVGEWVKTSA